MMVLLVIDGGNAAVMARPDMNLPSYGDKLDNSK
jgi:hypothetical protein